MKYEQRQAEIHARWTAIRAAFREFRGGNERFQIVDEHGQEWITEPATGGQWSVNDCTDPQGNDGFDFEQVTAPDEE